MKENQGNGLEDGKAEEKHLQKTGQQQVKQKEVDMRWKWEKIKSPSK